MDSSDSPHGVRELAERLKKLPFSSVELCGQRTFRMGDRITRFSDDENSTLTEAADALTAQDQRLAELTKERDEAVRDRDIWKGNCEIVQQHISWQTSAVAAAEARSTRAEGLLERAVKGLKDIAFLAPHITHGWAVETRGIAFRALDDLALLSSISGGEVKEEYSSSSPTVAAAPDGATEASEVTGWTNREFEDFLAYKLGFVVGFEASSEGWNGEHPCGEPVKNWLDEKATEFAQGQINRQRLDEALNAAAERRFDASMAALQSSGAPPISPSAASAATADQSPAEGGENVERFARLPRPLRAHASYINAALSWYHGGPADLDVREAWQFVTNSLEKLSTENDELRAADRDHLAATRGMEKRLFDQICELKSDAQDAHRALDNFGIPTRDDLNNPEHPPLLSVCGRIMLATDRMVAAEARAQSATEDHSPAGGES